MAETQFGANWGDLQALLQQKDEELAALRQQLAAATGVPADASASSTPADVPAQPAGLTRRNTGKSFDPVAEVTAAVDDAKAKIADAEKKLADAQALSLSVLGLAREFMGAARSGDRGAMLRPIVAQAFRAVGVESSGRVGAAQVSSIVLMLYAKLNSILPVYIMPPTEEQLNTVFRKVDTNGNGELEQDEVVQLCRVLLFQPDNWRDSIPLRILMALVYFLVLLPLATKLLSYVAYATCDHVAPLPWLVCPFATGFMDSHVAVMWVGIWLYPVGKALGLL